MRKFIFVLVLCVVVVGAAYTVRQHAHPAATSTHSNTPVMAAKNTDGFNKQAYSTTDPTSIWVIANKQHALHPKDYVPKDLVIPDVPLRVPGNESMQVRQVTATAMEEMFAGAKKDGIELMLSSGYRSYTYQVNLYNGYVAAQGQATADTQSARPGYSEHQTGLAADVEPVSKNCEVESCFGDTPEGKWVAANAYKYGFIVRYPTGDEAVTGYEPEPWHIRYIGTTLSNELHRTHTATLEQFFSVKGGTVYN
ncbi:MAG TPA: M15 family metallopeptidase [Candidatus Microsaccharimonas sp.]|nr:M15 family metallopeptidase [Candidatus Microsaccharimonas sp.]